MGVSDIMKIDDRLSNALRIRKYLSYPGEKFITEISHSLK